MSRLHQQETFSLEDEGPTSKSRLEDLGIELSTEIPYELDSMFPKVSGWGWKGPMKKKCKYLVKAEPLLEDMLFEGERVLYVSKGIRYRFSEFYFMGVWAALINHTVFVLTNLRLIMIHTNNQGTPKKTLWMIYYSEIRKFKSGLTGMVSLKLEDGKSLQFSGFPKADRKTMPAIFQQALNSYQKSGFNPEVTQSQQRLCYYCYDPVAKGDYECENCGATYWKPWDLAWRSFVFPGWGDLLMGHTLVAVMELFGGLGTWIAFLVMSGLGIAQEEYFLILFGFLILIFGNGYDAAITDHVARKGLHPKHGPSQTD